MDIFRKFNCKKVRQDYYGTSVENYLSKLPFQDIINTINNDAENLAKLPSEDNIPVNDGVVRVFKDENVYVAYCDSLRLILTTNGREKLTQVSILGDKENWKLFNSDSKGKVIYMINSPETKVYTVYTSCNVLVPTGRLLYDERYTNGTWNEYVYNNVKKIIDYIMSFNERNKFNKLYDKDYENQSC